MSVDDEWGDSTYETGVYALNLVYGNGEWLALGGLDTSGAGDGLAYASEPSGPWTMADIPLPTADDSPRFYNDIFYSAVYAEGKWTLVGATGNDIYIATAANASDTWQEATSSQSQEGRLWDVAYYDGLWVATSSGALYTATDPTGTWTKNTSGLTGALYSLAHGGGVWVAVGDKAYRATDPTGTWTEITALNPSPGVLADVAYGDGNWFVVGRGAFPSYTNVAKRATDPAGTWTDVTVGGTFMQGLYACEYLDETWIATGQATIAAETSTLRYATSLTGTWDSVEVPLNEAIAPRIAYDGEGGWGVTAGLNSDTVAEQGGGGIGWGLLL